MISKFRSRLYAGFLAAIIFVVIIGAIAYATFYKQDKTAELAGVLLILLIVFLLVYQTLKQFNNRRKAEDKLKKNLEELTIVHLQNTEQNWMLAGLAEVNDLLQGHAEVPVLAELVLHTLVKYLNAKAGAFYVYDDSEKQLVLSASFALTGKEKKEYQLHEGFVGQAGTEKEPLLIADVPAGSITIGGGTIDMKPAAALYTSLYHQGTLKGVIEVLSFETIEEKHIRLLKATSNNIALAVQSVQAKEKRLQLLQQIQQQKEALEKQQEALQQINAELEEKNKDIEAGRQSLLSKAKELEATSKYKSEFLANMSHELRTPLNSILILSKLLSDNSSRNLTEKQASHATLIYKAGSDLLQLINEILDLAKIEAGKAGLFIEDVSIKNIATNMEDLFRVVAEEKKIRYTVLIAPAVPASGKIDQQKVEQVLKNLLSNAFKFTKNGGEVALHFSISADSRQLVMSVRDNGIGIPQEKQQVIFEAFQQADNSTSRRFGGTGLGLSITKELMRILNGRVELVSEENKGSMFTVFIPLQHEMPGNQVASKTDITGSRSISSEQIRRPQGQLVNKTHKTILIIEDDEIFASVIKDFADANGYRAVVALNGDEGLRCAHQYKPAAIILDILLPGIDGGQLLKIFKSEPALKDIPVHVISSSEDAKAVSEGALSVLKKPVNKEDLDAAFNSIEQYHHAAVQKIMVISPEGSLANEIEGKLQEKRRKITVNRESVITEALKKLTADDYDCIIAETGNDPEERIEQLKTLGEDLLPKDIPTIVYISHDVTAADEQELKRTADVIIRKSALSSSTLMDEMEVFLNKVGETHSGKPGALRPILNGLVLKNKKVLLVDDDMRNVFALSALLEQEHMQVLTAADGKEALDLLHSRNDIDIVLMDIMMPEMDGYEAMSRIRRDTHLADLPIIALTAKALAGDKEKCTKAGASDFITKPVETDKLVAMMKALLE